MRVHLIRCGCLILGMSLGLLAVAQTDTSVLEAPVSIQQVQLLVPFAGVDEAPIYATIINKSDKALTLNGAHGGWAAQFELLDSKSVPVKNVLIAAHSTLQLGKGAYYLRAKGLKNTIRSGEQLHLTLSFEGNTVKECSLKAVSAYDQPHH